MSSFNAAILFNESLNNQITNLAMDLAIRSVMECSRKYGFDGEEAIRELGLGLNLFQLQIDTIPDTETTDASELPDMPVANKTKKNNIVLSLSKREIVAKKTKATTAVVKPPFPLPYNGIINNGFCLGLKNNHCLFTQCELKPVLNSDYCKTCLGQTDKNSNGKPDYGTITDRIQVGIMDYRDPKGNGPIHYTKFIKKLGITQEDVIREANRLNVVLDPIHLVEPEIVINPKQKATDKKKGRPQKNDKVVDIDECTDLFAQITLSNENEDDDEALPSLSSSSSSSTQELAPINVLEAVKIPTGKSKAETLKLEKARKAEEVKLEKARKLEEKNEKLRKAEQAKQAKLDKASKLAEKNAKPVAKNTKKNKDTIKEPEVTQRTIIIEYNDDKETDDVIINKTPVITNNKDNVTQFEFDGVMYFRTADNLLYNDAKEMVGKINSSNDVILYNGESDQESDEESEDSYDEE